MNFNWYSEADLADRDDEDVRFNRRMGIDDNREGDEWNQPRQVVGAPAKAPEPPAEPRQVEWWTLIPPEDRYEVIRAFWHFHMVRHYPAHHDRHCFCGQPMGDEQPIDVPIYGFNDIRVPHDWKV